MKFASNVIWGKDCPVNIAYMKIYDKKINEDILMGIFVEKNVNIKQNQENFSAKIKNFIEELSKWFYSYYVVNAVKCSSNRIYERLKRLIYKRFDKKEIETAKIAIIFCFADNLTLYTQNWGSFYYFSMGLNHLFMHEFDLGDENKLTQLCIDWEPGNTILITEPDYMSNIKGEAASACFEQKNIDDMKMKRILKEFFNTKESFGFAITKNE